jgi:hypothetical protein
MRWEGNLTRNSLEIYKISSQGLFRTHNSSRKDNIKIHLKGKGYEAVN